MENEFKVYSKEELKKTDKLGYAFISKPEYKIPTQTPKVYDCAKTSTITCATENPNPK